MFKLIKSLLEGMGRRTVKIVSDYLPEYKTDGAACFDLASNETHTFNHNELYVLGTGLSAEIPSGYCILVFARSSLGIKKLIIPNSVGVIDSDYRGEIKVPIISLNEDSITIEKGQRIAQAMLVKLTRANLIITDSLTSTSRGAGGFGSTGNNG
jgi:dUTP pyrophosphatase